MIAFSINVKYEIGRFIELPKHAQSTICLFFKTFITPIDCEDININVNIFEVSNIDWVKNDIPNKSSIKGYPLPNPGTYLAKISYLKKVIENACTLSNFKNENNIKNIPI